jgi:hypothetical protein
LLDLNSQTADLVLALDICKIFRNNLNGFWNFYNGTNGGAASPKALVFKGIVVKKEGIK